MDSDTRFVREFIFDRFGVFDEVAAQAVRYWDVFSRFGDDADVISLSLQLQCRLGLCAPSSGRRTLTP